MWKISDTSAEGVAAVGVSLLTCYPPRKRRGALDCLLTLCKWKDAERVLDCIYKRMSPADTVWTVAQCPSSVTSRILANPHNFIQSEYNRLGDGYRCPVCNKYVLGGKFSAEYSKIASVTRQIESAANSIFTEYAELYYGKECTTSVYAWECNSDCGGSTTIGLAILLKRCFQSLDEISMTNPLSNEKRGVWQSAHVGIIDVTSGSYSFQSFFNLDISVFCRGGPSENAPSSSTRVNGSAASRIFCFEHHAAGTSVDLDDLLATIGEQVQETENSFYGHLLDVNFERVQFLLRNIRGTPQLQGFQFQKNCCCGKQQAAGRSGDGDKAQVDHLSEGRYDDHEKSKEHFVSYKISNFCAGAVRDERQTPQELGGHAAATDRVQAHDASRNSYCCNETLSEASQKKSSTGNAVLSILQNLQLEHSPEKYCRRLERYFKQYNMLFNVDAFLSLMDDDQLLELDDGTITTALEFLVPAPGDRQKIELYIAQNTGSCAK